MIRFPHIRCEFWGWGVILRVWINNSSLMRGTPELSPGERAGGGAVFRKWKDGFQEEGRIHAEVLR